MIATTPATTPMAFDRWAGPAGVLWGVRGAVRLAGSAYWAPQSPLDYAAVATYSLALLALMPVAVGLRSLQEPPPGRWGRTGRWGSRLLFLGAAMAGVGNLVEDGLGFPPASLVYVTGALLLPVGLLLLGIATLRAGVLPRWTGWVLLVSMLGFLFIEWGGAFVVGAACVALGALLSTCRRQEVRPTYAARS
jgi:hypothetical protein